VPGCPISLNQLGLSELELTALGRATLRAHDMVLRAVLDAGGSANNIVLVDIKNALAGHRLCNWNRWANDLDVTALFDSYHPNAAGYTAEANIVRQTLAGLWIEPRTS
jgi:hypothetical protein